MNKKNQAKTIKRNYELEINEVLGTPCKNAFHTTRIVNTNIHQIGYIEVDVGILSSNTDIDMVLSFNLTSNVKSTSD